MNYSDVKKIYEANFSTDSKGKRSFLPHIGTKWPMWEIVIEQQAPKHVRMLNMTEDIGEPMPDRLNVVLDAGLVMGVFRY